MDKLDNPAFVLFHSYWSWQVPAWALITSYARDVYGLSLPPDRKKAAAIMENKERTVATAAQMAEVIHSNTAIAVDMIDPLDAIKVYGQIMAHMADWINHASQPQLRRRDIPIQGLREFNALANKLFPVAHRYGYYREPEKNMTTSLQALLGGGVSTKVEHRFNDNLIQRLEMLYREYNRRQRSAMVR